MVQVLLDAKSADPVPLLSVAVSEMLDSSSDTAARPASGMIHWHPVMVVWLWRLPRPTYRYRVTGVTGGYKGGR